MSDKPLIIKSTFYNIKPDELEQIRRAIQKQMEESIPVVMLPCGFELAEVNVELLEKIQGRLNHRANEHLDGDYYVRIKDINEVFDEELAKLKGENNE